MTAAPSSSRNTRLCLVVAAAIGLLAAQPLLFGKLAAGSDTYFHIHRLWQVHTLINQGIWFSRWSPDLPFGFGSPLFNYYGPLPYYFAEAVVRLTNSLVVGYIIALVISLMATAMGMAMWLRQLMSDWGALLGAAAFVFAPVALGNIYSRGALAEPVALAAVPCVLYALHRLATEKSNGFGYLLMGALAYAVIALSHNVTLLLFTPIAIVYAVGLRLAGYKNLQGGLVLVWGLALSAFFVAPALLEPDLVQLERLYTSAAYDYHHNFQPLIKLLGSLPPLDTNLIGNTYEVPIGMAPLALAGLGLFALTNARNRTQIRLLTSLIALVGALVCIFMSTPQSRVVWEAIPFLRVLQFGRRWLVPAALCLASLIGYGGDFVCGLLPKPWQKLAVTACGLVALIASIWSAQIIVNLFPITYTPTAQAIAELEQRYNVIGTTNTGEYLPRAVQQMPALVASPLLRDNRRLDPTSLPPAAHVQSETYSSLAYALTLDTPQPAELVFATFYFAGWQARVDGIATEIKPSEPHGFIRVSVPAGRHQVQVKFEDTPVRSAATWVSLVAAGLWLLGAGWLVYSHFSARYNLKKLGRES